MNRLDRNKENNDQTTLPEIVNNRQKKPSGGFVGGGNGNKAAGFRNELNFVENNSAKGIMTGVDFRKGAANELGSGLIGS